jgi:Aspartokinases
MQTGLRNVGSIIQHHASQPLLVVVSALGKTTDQLEAVVKLAREGKDYQPTLQKIKEIHQQIILDLFGDHASLTKELEKMIDQIEKEASGPGEYDFVYDQVVCFGELLSSLLMHRYLESQRVSVQWIDARKYISTDNTFREGKVDWVKSEKNIQELRSSTRSKHNCYARLHWCYIRRIYHYAGARRLRLYGCYFRIMPPSRIRYDLERCAGCDEC